MDTLSALFGKKPSGGLDVFSPKNFSEYVGQERAKSIARVMVDAALIDHRSLPNILIQGAYGLGKTALAKVIFNEANQPYKILDAVMLNKEAKISLDKPYIIDEIHNLDREVADSLNILIDQGITRIIGCTTNPGALPPAFRSRFRIIHLVYYTVSEIHEILRLITIRRGINLAPDILEEIAKRSRLNPRLAISYLSFALDFQTANRENVIDTSIVKAAFNTLGVDNDGFLEQDHSYMRALSSDRPVGLHYIASKIGIDPKTIEAEIEPFLLQTGHIDRMPRGRIKVKELL